MIDKKYVDYMVRKMIENKEKAVKMTKVEMAKKIIEEDGNCIEIFECEDCPAFDCSQEKCVLDSFSENGIKKWMQDWLDTHEGYISVNGAEAEQEMTGVKHDGGKLRWSLLPLEAIKKIIEVFMFGANKYGDKNWLGGMKWTRLYDAAMRHLTAFKEKDDYDSETKLYHLAHAGCCVLMLLTYQILGIGEDDR